MCPRINQGQVKRLPIVDAKKWAVRSVVKAGNLNPNVEVEMITVTLRHAVLVKITDLVRMIGIQVDIPDLLLRMTDIDMTIDIHMNPDEIIIMDFHNGEDEMYLLSN